MLSFLVAKPQFPNGIVSSVSFVSTTNTARSLAGFVLLALALMRCFSRKATSPESEQVHLCL
jgi:hypothetical protein